jgi:predicted ATPase
MFRFGLSNLRRLKDIPLTELRPLTLLVGRNSSGKSTFLRAFALLRQSLMTRTSSPILWYGDLVDFGSFLGSVADNKLSNDITLRFGLDELTVSSTPYLYDPSGLPRFRVDREYSNITLEVSIAALEDRTRIRSLTLTANNCQLTYKLLADEENNVTGLTLNDEDILPYASNAKLSITTGAVFPEIVALRPGPDNQTRVNLNDPAIFSAEFTKLIYANLDQRVKAESRRSFVARLLMLPSFDKDSIRVLSQSHVLPSARLRQFASEVSEGRWESLYKRASLLFGASQFAPLLHHASMRLRDSLSSTLYIGPARARSERYYRYQDLAVSEIDPDGKNFPMFLNSLTRGQLENLSDWVERLFNYRIELNRPTGAAGHISINLLEAGNSTNVVDTGYGVSQILPVLGQIWWAANRSGSARPARYGREASVIAIEQPELHLHPAHQALLADALVDIPEQRSEIGPHERPSGKLNFLVETHSEALINRLGELVSMGRLNPENVQILIFEPDGPRQTRVSTARFGSRGELIEWPYGFFVPGPQ